MTARILVVDDVLANVRLLEAKLAAEYFDVVTALNGAEALEALGRTKPDIVLLDVMMPGIDGIEVCRRIKTNPATQHIPVVMVTTLDQPEDRVRGLEAGADDFLTKPVNDLSLFCRVKGLVRLKMLTDELRSRTGTDPFGLATSELLGQPATGGRILLFDNPTPMVDRLCSVLSDRHTVMLASTQQEVTDICGFDGGGVELIVVNLDIDGSDGLRICSQLKTLESTRQIPILIIVGTDDHQRLLRALDMGVNDYLIRPVDRQELHARVASQIRRYRYTEQLRLSVRASLELAVTDALTGLYNRRYLEMQLAGLIDNAVNRGKLLSVLTLDVDYFKSVNDSYGHDAGDRVLQDVAGRIRSCVRSVDLPCRTGGEEFVVVLPDTDLATAERIGERIRKSVAGRPFHPAPGCTLTVTASLGVASIGSAEESVEALLKRADKALYRAKHEGRNRVVPVAA
jgi:two-component system cell cycle response regulator